ncbi:MAG: dockerin type I repeat-containing protein [Clostridia bacterium]|nr:dockerin type I repeat-containing protein [Clostridia bacterium]
MWKYEKDYSVASGSDCAWLDEVVWSGDPGAGETLPGDVDGDGEVTVSDALLVMRYAMGIISELPHIENADMDGSGVIDISDALLIMRRAMDVES